MPKLAPVLERNTTEHPVAVQYLADAVMRRPLTTALSAAVLATIVLGCVGWAMVGGVSELLALTGTQPAVQATLPMGRG